MTRRDADPGTVGARESYGAPAPPSAFPQYAIPRHAGPPLLDARALVTHLTGWFFGGVLLATAALMVIPRFEGTFKDFKLDLPELTKVVLSSARWLRHYGWVLLPLPFVHAVLVALWYPGAGSGARRTYRLLLSLCVCGIFGAVILAMFLPYITLLEGIAGTKK